MRHFVIGNGPSLNDLNLDKLIGERTWACNRIYRLFDKTAWRPTDYVRSELPEYDGQDVCDDLIQMAKYDCRLWVQAGFFRYVGRTDVIFGRPVIPFLTCNGGALHEWHFDLGDYICGYGTVVNQAVQLAVMEGATEIVLVGCDMGTGHFYNEPFVNHDKALSAHKMAARCSPVSIITTSKGLEDVYPYVSFDEVTHG